MNVKPGDLAVLTRDEEISNIGKIGKVLVRDISGFYDDKPRWEMEFPTPLLCICGGTATLVSVKDSCLKPVSGLPMEEETENEIKEPA